MFEELTTLEACAAKKAELRSRIGTAQDAELTNIETELAELEKRENELRAKQAAVEKRNHLMQRVASGVEGNVLENPAAQRSAADENMTAAELRSATLASKEYRSAFAKTLMQRSLNESERRALETVTTTSETFVAATEGTVGVNNGGVAIPTELNLSLLKAIELQSPIFRDINKTSIAGELRFPYAVSKKKAKRYGKNQETTDNDDGEVEFATLTLSAAEISVTIPVSWKLEAMSVDQFMSYLLQELTNQVARSKVYGALYGVGGDDDMKGITVAAIQKSYTGSVVDAIAANLGFLTAEKKINAKIYLSTTAAEALQFAKNTDGDYIFPLALGLPKNIAGYALETDPYLEDGDIVIGNLTRFARLNTVEAMSVTRESKGKKRRSEYTAYEVCASNAQPDSIVYIKQTT